MAVDAGKQQHRDATAGDQHIDALRDERFGLFGVFLFDFPSEGVAFIGTQDLAGFESHGVDAGDPVFQAIFANLVMEPGDVARVDRYDAAALAELTGVQHRRFAEGDDGDIDDRTAFVQAGVLEVADDEGVVAFAFGPDGVADRLAGAAEFDDGVGVGIVRGDAVHFDVGAGIDDLREVRLSGGPSTWAPCS